LGRELGQRDHCIVPPNQRPELAHVTLLEDLFHALGDCAADADVRESDLMAHHVGAVGEVTVQDAERLSRVPLRIIHSLGDFRGPDEQRHFEIVGGKLHPRVDQPVLDQ